MLNEENLRRELYREWAQAVEALRYIDGGASADEKRWRWISTASDDERERFSEQINEDFDQFVDNEIRELRDLASKMNEEAVC